MLKLHHKIALLQFLVGGTIVLLGLAANYQYFSNAIHQEARDSLQLLSNNIANQVNFVLQEKAAKVKALTSAPVVEDLLLKSNAEYALFSTQQRNNHIADLNRQWMKIEDKNSPFLQAFLNNSVAQYFLTQFDLSPGEYGEIFLTNRYGAVVASTEKLTTFAHAHKYWWKASYNGGRGKTFFDDRGFDISVAGYVLGIVVPVKKDGQIIGILKCNVRIQGVLDEIVDFPSTEYSQTLIVRDRGAVVLQPDHEPLSTKVNPEIQTKLDELQAGSLSFDDGAVPSFAGFFPILISQETDQFSFGGNPKGIDQRQGNQGEGWNVVVIESMADALQLSQQFSRYFYAMNILVIFVLAVIALYVGRRIVAPLQEFSKAAKLIGEGKFNIKLVVPSQDELGAVAIAFNDMSESLATTMATKDEYALEIKQRKQTEIALQSSEKQLLDAQRIAKIGSWELDLTTNNLSWSDEVYRIFDLEPRQFPATYEAFLENIHPDDRDSVDEAYRESVKNKEPYNIIHRLLLSNGTLKYVNERCETFYDKTDNPIRSIGTVQDVTESILVEQERQELETQLRQKHKMEAVGYMAGGIAHNFNNNLSIILGNVELSQMETSNNKIIHQLENAKIAIRRSRDLVQKIITYSRNGIQSKTLIQLPAIVSETLSLLQSTLPRTVSIEQSVSPVCDSVVVNADASQIQEVLVNLCNNAVHAMDEQGELKISLDTVELSEQDIPAQYEQTPGHYIKLSVQDTGCGIPTEVLDKIFDPFYTTKEAYEGAGMGLATVEGIVAQHGGLIKVNSVLGQGTVFELYFPIVDAETTEPAATNTELSRGSEQILFVDDDEMIASLGEKLLTQMGYQVSVMTNSNEALKLFTVNADRFDLVITDQTMPNLCGKDLIQKAKKIRPDILTILCTGFSSKVDEEKAADLGINAFLMKPLELPELSLTVRRVLDAGKK